MISLSSNSAPTLGSSAKVFKASFLFSKKPRWMIRLVPLARLQSKNLCLSNREWCQWRSMLQPVLTNLHIPTINSSLLNTLRRRNRSAKRSLPSKTLWLTKIEFKTSVLPTSIQHLARSSDTSRMHPRAMSAWRVKAAIARLGIKFKARPFSPSKWEFSSKILTHWAKFLLNRFSKTSNSSLS